MGLFRCSTRQKALLALEKWAVFNYIKLAVKRGFTVVLYALHKLYK